MHELSIAKGIVETVRRQLSDSRACEVRTVRLRVGELAGITPDSLRICFEVVSQETPLQGAALEIENVPGISLCLGCNREFKRGNFVMGCPFCENSSLELISGDELDVVEIELAE